MVPRGRETNTGAGNPLLPEKVTVGQVLRIVSDPAYPEECYEDQEKARPQIQVDFGEGVILCDCSQGFPCDWVERRFPTAKEIIGALNDVFDRGRGKN
jgi:hypothetical protein